MRSLFFYWVSIAYFVLPVLLSRIWSWMCIVAESCPFSCTIDIGSDSQGVKRTGVALTTLPLLMLGPAVLSVSAWHVTGQFYPFCCRIHLWFRLMGGLQAKSMTSQRYRAVTRWRICVTMAALWQQQDGGYALLFYIFNSTVIDWTCFIFIFQIYLVVQRLWILV